MKILIKGPLPLGLKKYESVIEQIINDMGLGGKLEEFKEEGRLAVCQAESMFHLLCSTISKDSYMEKSIREHFRGLLGI